MRKLRLGALLRGLGRHCQCNPDYCKNSDGDALDCNCTWIKWNLVEHYNLKHFKRNLSVGRVPYLYEEIETTKNVIGKSIVKRCKMPS